jgi:integrase
MSRAGSIYRDKDSRLWSFRVDVAPLGAPRQQVHKRGFKTQREAQAALTELLGNVRSGTHVNPSTMTFDGWAQMWLAGLPATGLRPATLAHHRDMIGHARRHLGDARLQGLLPADLNRAYGKLLEEGLRPERGLSRATVRKVHTSVRKCLGEAVRQGVLARNPADLATPPSAASARPPEQTVWSPQETATFFRFVEAEGDRNAPLYRLIAMSGLRRGEALGIKWSDLDGSRLAVRRQVTVSIGREPRIADVKTARGRRNIDLDDETVARLRAHRREQTEERLALGLGGRTEFMFTDERGELLDPRNITGHFARAVRASGLPRIKLHSLRHGHASHLLAAGASVKLVADRLGHASASITLDTYSHVIGSQGADAAAAVAALVDGRAR